MNKQPIERQNYRKPDKVSFETKYDINLPNSIKKKLYMRQSVPCPGLTSEEIRSILPNHIKKYSANRISKLPYGNGNINSILNYVNVPVTKKRFDQLVEGVIEKRHENKKINNFIDNIMSLEERKYFKEYIKENYPNFDKIHPSLKKQIIMKFTTFEGGYKKKSKKQKTKTKKSKK